VIPITHVLVGLPALDVADLDPPLSAPLDERFCRELRPVVDTDTGRLPVEALRPGT
jgi:hypothetical protein